MAASSETAPLVRRTAKPGTVSAGDSGRVLLGLVAFAAFAVVFGALAVDENLARGLAQANLYKKKYYVPQSSADVACEGDLEFDSCGSACHPTCAEQWPVCMSSCSANCGCPAGTVLAFEGGTTCTSQCPEPPPHCSDDRVWDECASSCEPSCEDPNPVCTLECVARCRCPEGSVVVDDAGTCGPLAECGNATIGNATLGNATLAPAAAPQVVPKSGCPGGRVHSGCGRVRHEPTCANPDPTNVKMCKPGCSCPMGMVLGETGTCIPKTDCPVSPGPKKRWCGGETCDGNCYNGVCEESSSLEIKGEGPHMSGASSGIFMCTTSTSTTFQSTPCK